MTYVQPQFNITVNVWRNGNAVTNAPDLTPLGNLSPGRIVGVNTELDSFNPHTQGGMWLRLPANTDIRDGKASAGQDTVEAPAGSGKFYVAAWVDDIGTGFANAHRFAMLLAVGPWNTPFGSGGGGPSPPPGKQIVVNPFSASSSVASVILTCVPFIVDPSIVMVAVAAIDAAGRPKINGAVILSQTSRAFTVGAHTLTIWYFAIYTSAPMAYLNVSDEFNTSAWRMVAGYSVPRPRLANNTQTGNNGAFGPPTPAPPNNPFGFPIIFCDVAVAFDGVIAGETLAVPYLFVVSSLPIVAFATTWNLQLVQTLNPPNSPPAPTFGPLMGWNKWAWIAGEIAQGLG